MSELNFDPYVKLANTLDKIPNSFPKDPDGIYLKILQWIFTPEEAELVSQMKLMGETVEELSERLNLPLEGLADQFEIMTKKGQIHALNTSTGRRFALIPFVVGIYEEQLNKMDSEFAKLMEEYVEKSNFKGLYDTEPAIFRVVPVNKGIQTELTIFPYEQAEQMVENAKSWGVRECICKKQQDLLGHTCEYPTKVCLNFARKENVFENHELTQAITKEEALNYLRQTEDDGLIHCSMNIQSGHSYICNCCTCCCGILRGLTERKQPLAFVNSNYVIDLDKEICEGCGTCVDRCQFNALSVGDDICEVEASLCVGCGVCTITCPNEALSLIPRDQKSTPPETVRDWMTQKAMSRMVDPSDLL
ncbi:MAG: ATP-binding protein [Candidatus Hodarchaeales archaeon]|jgi:ferredoxin